MAFSIAVSQDSFRLSNAGVVTGINYINVDGQSFPSPGWYDFPVVILGWWLESITRLGANPALTVECLFMDGPFYFTLSSRASLTWTVACKERTSAGECLIIPAITFDSECVSKAIIGAASLISAACERQAWDSEDLATLKGRLATAKKLFETHS
jgi:hypothetical protein